MKSRFLLVTILLCWQSIANAANLIDVYQQAQTSDPIFQQAISQRLASKEGVPISVSALLPNINLTANPSITRSGFAGSNYQSTIGSSANVLTPRNNTQRAYDLVLTVTQTVFDYAQFANLAEAIATSKEADAILNSALQNLMIRVSKAYFAILKDEDDLSYAQISRLAYAKQLDQIKEQYKVALKTQTEYYTAEASYDASVADYIATQTTLRNDIENLRVITGQYYPHLAKLSERFPLLTPAPTNIEKWVKTALMQNWDIKASEYNLDNARATIKQQFGGHYPTVNIQGIMDRQYVNNINSYNAFTLRRGPGTQTDRGIVLNFAVPIFSGGEVTAQTRQATYNYEIAQQQLEQVIRNTINTTRQSYLSLTSGISQIAADQAVIKSTISSLEGMRASYELGTETLVNVINQQQKVYAAQTQYAADRYAFVNNILLLKQAAGTLSFNDLRAINAWLIEG